MAELPGGALRLAIETAVIASSFSTLGERAGAVLEALRRVVPFQAGQIALVNLKSREVTALVVEGYDDDVRAYLTSPAVCDEFELLGLDRSTRPMRLADLPVPLSEVRGWAEYLAPAGFRGGLGVGLRTPDGRHIGILGLNTYDVAHPTIAARDLIGMLVPLIAHAVDPLRSIALAAGLIRGATAGILLTRTDEALPLPGLPTHPLLSEGSRVLTLVAQLTGRPVHLSFLSPPDGDSAGHGHTRITVLASEPHPPYYVVAAVVTSPPGDLRTLTARELQVLGLLVEGWSNRRIARTLIITERTVATHVEHILAKLDAQTRSLAATRALNLGAYVPRALLPKA